MKILFCVEKDVKHGAARSGKQLISGLMALGHELTVVVPSNIDDITFYSELGCEIIKVPYTFCSISKSGSFLKNLIKIPVRALEHRLCLAFSVPYLQRAVREKKYDVIHCNSSRIDLAGLVSKRTGVPMVWHIREFGDVDFNRVDLNGNLIGLMNSISGTLVGVSQAVCSHWKQKGIQSGRIKCIYNGICETQKKRDYKRGSTVRFIFIGTVSDTKGQKQVIEALGKSKNVQNVQVDFVGNGDAKYIKELIKTAEDLGVLDSVRFLGYSESIAEELSKYDCGLVCSRSEGFGRTTAEYMMAGLPVIASDTGANTELVAGGRTGLIYRYGDAEDLKDKIEYAVNNPETMEKYGIEGRLRAEKLFSNDRYVREIQELYFSIIGQIQG